MDLVLLERLRFDRPERVETDMEGDTRDVEPADELRREMQPRRRRSCRAPIAREHCLVAVWLGGRLRDVGRKRRLAGRRALEPQPPASAAQRFQQLDGPET